MKRYFELAAALASLVGMGSGALAADLAVKAPVGVAVAGCAWCGFYVGDNIGYAWGRNSENSTFTAPVPPFVATDVAAVSAAGSPRTNTNGITGGAQAGYNWQTGAAVFGIEADISAFDLRGNTGGTFPFPSTLPGGAVGPPTTSFAAATSLSSDWLFTGRGRLGWANGDWLVYGTGGVAVGNVKVSQTIGLAASFVETATVSSTQVGWTAGAGFEYLVTRNWSVKGEYLYVDLGKASATGVLSPAFAGITYTTTARLTANIARIGVNYHFNSPVVAKY
jgi:outer membrane immunogenic protein